MPESHAQAYAAALFEKAQGGIRALAQIDSQIGDLLAQRRAVQHDLTGVQTQINDEFSRLMRESDELPAKVLAEISGGNSRAQEPPSPETTSPEATRRATFADSVA
jgi:hypothetical protein